ncbi:hypothetical protein EKL30_16390 [Candidimonas sp. SYP-B2681]|uniref:hypothetical protein n=1 Tax=Candidimonas sp. SYP-B2681 TaxID=2497686 RepID=UPI000F86042C|nr:hypothetical protein [Candidimonas sp. SYP-B2681]RTZ40699.1 hypothetical protein EKL30_16390 [Candidimonas sp. SYP-B2681]
MILPKLSGALIGMSLLGSAYAASILERRISLNQWVLMCGAANGAAEAIGATRQDCDSHRRTTQKHLTRYATEHGATLSDFDALFDTGRVEGKTLVASRLLRQNGRLAMLMQGFQRDKSIPYHDVEKALSSC